VMYLGRIVESADHATLWRNPRHPYTRALLDAVPTADPARKRTVATIRGELSQSAAGAGGCRFRARCPIAVARCATDDPALRPVADNHFVACHLA
jgi:peptide/nickel transport system ATP-binding protein